MPSLSWNEIRQRAIAFSHDFKGTTEERAEAQSVWNEFFHVFGIKRRTVASSIRKLSPRSALLLTLRQLAA